MTAEEMFEQLGYKLEFWYYPELHAITYTKNDDDGERTIEFNRNTKKFYFYDDDGSFDVNMDEFKAIHQQLKELNWLDE